MTHGHTHTLDQGSTYWFRDIFLDFIVNSWINNWISIRHFSKNIYGFPVGWQFAKFNPKYYVVRSWATVINFLVR